MVPGLARLVEYSLDEQYGGCGDDIFILSHLDGFNSVKSYTVSFNPMIVGDIFKTRNWNFSSISLEMCIRVLTAGEPACKAVAKSGIFAPANLGRRRL